MVLFLCYFEDWVSLNDIMAAWNLLLQLQSCCLTCAPQACDLGTSVISMNDLSDVTEISWTANN